MECLTEVKKKVSIKAGDVLLYSKTKAFLIIETNDKFIGTQIFNNNGYYHLGFSNYYNISANKVAEDIIRENGDYIRVINLKDMKVSF
ncbi:hypothetical protein ACFHWD_03240 [Clostridium sp. MT-14]|uniref:hypothetical protein n=1 Tax=Clostridium sp. MT-14 TaxID=3348360 RepID=UPI0035F2A8F6